MENQEETANLVTGEAVTSLETKLHGNSRQGFIAKVYGIISCQLLMTALAVVGGMHYPQFKVFAWKQWWLLLLAFITTLVTMLMIVCCSGVSRRVPVNYVVLAVFTAAESYLV
jgi:FtsH-binding integral membrane protein